MVIDREVDTRSLTAVEIADRLDVSKPVLARAIGKLADDGLIELTADLVDGRARQIRLARAGKRRLKSILPNYFRELALYMQEIE